MRKNNPYYTYLMMFLASCGGARNIVTDPVVSSYDSYEGLVMAGYQGWFNAEGDGADRGFYHYKGKDGFRPGSATIDLWPDVSEYEKTYPTEFRMADGNPAYVFSSEDSTTVDTHFRWMKEYGLDGVFMQRFVAEIRGESGKRHFDKVLGYAMKSAQKYNRAIAVMYDLSGISGGECDIVLRDIKELSSRFDNFDHEKNPSYLYHNGKPLVSVWGVGFDDRRRYTVEDCARIVDGLREAGFSIMLGVPTYWRTYGQDTLDDEVLHELIQRCDIVMPWFVGRYDEKSFEKFKSLVVEDMKWCEEKGVDYAPLVFPGFSWKNMAGEKSFSVARNEGSFFGKQIDWAISSGAKMLYVAMFDEIDEGTAIFKCSKEVPVTEKGTVFVPIDPSIGNDHYLKMAGEAASRLKKR